MPPPGSWMCCNCGGYPVVKSGSATSVETRVEDFLEEGVGEPVATGHGGVIGQESSEEGRFESFQGTFRGEALRCSDHLEVEVPSRHGRDSRSRKVVGG